MMTRLLHGILDLARWAPSGDNDQPWRFRILGDDKFEIVVTKVRIDLYSKNAWPTYISIGCLLEAVSLAASSYGYKAEFKTDSCKMPGGLSITVTLAAAQAQPDPISAFIKERSVNRRSLSTRKITQEHRALLSAAAGDNIDLVLLETGESKCAIIKATLQSALIRLTIPETYEVHRRILKWGRKISEHGIPDETLGMDNLSLRLAEWAFQSMKRLLFCNRYLGGTFVSHLEMDIVPNILCGGHLYLRAKTPPKTPDNFIAYGRAVQRVWLTASSLGIQQQPNISTLAFAEFSRNGENFTVYAPAWKRAQKMQKILDEQILLPGTDPRSVFWLGRVGYGNQAQARSIRLPLEKLLID